MSGLKQTALVDALEAIIDEGVRLDAEIRIGVAGVDLIYLGVKALACPADVADQWRLERIEGLGVRAAPESGA